MSKLNRITVRGYKSIRLLEKFELRNLNVLIGANGAGKSNFISIFQMLAAVVDQRLQLYVQEHDGPDALLYRTRKHTTQLDAEFYFNRNGYRISLKPAGERFIFAREETWFSGDIVDSSHALGFGHREALLPDVKGDTFAPYVRPAIAGWRVYHFHDTSNSAPVRQAQAVRDNLRLKPDASNLAPFLRSLRDHHEENYKRIIEIIRLAAPFFGDFVHRDDPGERVELEWFEVTDPDTPLGPRQLSDGTLRFICLATLLLQPASLQPATILIDEPELGLHPYALALLVNLLRQVAESKQLIVSTQSVELVNDLTPQDLIVVSHDDEGSTFVRLEQDQLKAWLDDYALGELWKMNVIGGRPSA